MSLHHNFNAFKKIDILCFVCFEIEKADNGTQPYTTALIYPETILQVYINKCMKREKNFYILNTK